MIYLLFYIILHIVIGYFTHWYRLFMLKLYNIPEVFNTELDKPIDVCNIRFKQQVNAI